MKGQTKPMQNAAKVIDGGCGDRSILPELVNGRTGNMMVFYQSICGFPGFSQCFPERCIPNHNIILSFFLYCILISPLDYSRYNDYNYSENLQ